MLARWLPAPILASVVFFGLLVNLIFWGVIVFTLGLIKLVFRVRPVSVLLHWAYKGWCVGNTWAIKSACTELQINVRGSLKADSWYLLIANHQSSLDIVLLTALGQLPAPKFFLKDELKFVPFVGMGAWAMDMPFMKRVSKEKLAKNPKLKGLDVERTKQSCRYFREHPTTIINFVEGSRFTVHKHAQQQSEFTYLLRPKAGGIAFALSVLGSQFDAMLNTSIVYTGVSDSILTDFFAGKLSSIQVDIDVTPIDVSLLGDYQSDRQFRMEFQEKLNQIWHAKDQHIAQMKRQPQPQFQSQMDESAT